MTGLLKRVVLVCLLVTFVMGGVWPFDKKKKAEVASQQVDVEEGPQMADKSAPQKP